MMPGPILLRCLCGLVLAVAASAAAAAEPPTSKIRLVWQGPDVNTLGAPSRDGRWLSYADAESGDLAVRDLKTGGRRFVTRKNPTTQQGEFAYFSVISPDGKSVALAWFNGDSFYDLRLAEIPREGEAPSPPRVIHRNAEAGFVQPCAFSPDGKQVLTLFFRRDNISQIALVSTEDGTIRTLKSLNWIYPKRMDFSPDGRWIVYDNLSADGVGERDIFVLAVDGSQEIRLLEGPANDLFPLWSADGREILFSSDRSGSTGVWAVRVEQGRTAGEPRLVHDGLDRPLLLGLTAAGDLYYGVRSGQTDVHVAEIGSSESSAPLITDSPAIADTPGRNFGAAFSPDGSALAYLSLRGSENYGVEHRAVVLYSLERKISQELPVRLAHIERLAWSPDSSRLLLAGSDRRARSGLFEFELESQETQLAVLAPRGDFRGIEGTYLASGKEVIYARPGPPALVSLNLADHTERVLYRPSSNSALSLPAVSPEGGRLAFAQVDGAGGTGHILLLDIGSRQASELLSLPSGRLTSLTWMPGGESLLVGTEGSRGAQLWKVSAAGDSMQPTPSPAKRRPGISVHPDGRRVALTIGETEEQIFVLEHAAHAATDSH